jgi:hypothetical protein
MYIQKHILLYIPSIYLIKLTESVEKVVTDAESNDSLLNSATPALTLGRYLFLAVSLVLI